MDAVAKMKDSTADAYIRAHQHVCAILVCRDHVIPFGIRLYVTQAHRLAAGLCIRKTTALTAQLIREFKAPPGVAMVVLFDAYDLCSTIVKACRETPFHVASTLKSHRRLFELGWKLKAGRYGRNLFRRRRTDTLDLSKPYGQVHDRFVDAGWLAVSTIGPLHVVFSRQGNAKTILGLVTDAPKLSAADVIRTYEKRWTIAQWLKDNNQLLRLGQYQNRSYWPAVTHLHLVCFAYALLTLLRIERHGGQGRQTRAKAADLSTATTQNQLRRVLWGDAIIYLKEKRHGLSVLEELEQLRVA
jgi:hypothetical protein